MLKIHMYSANILIIRNNLIILQAVNIDLRLAEDQYLSWLDHEVDCVDGPGLLS